MARTPGSVYRTISSPHYPVLMTSAVNKQGSSFAPGLTVKVRDELWLITSVAQSVDGYMLKVRGLSEFVRDTTASFYTALDIIEVVDPSQATVVPDKSPRFRTSRLWLETTLRQTPIPLYQKELSVAREMLMDPLDYQLSAVQKALSDDNLRPRVLIADAVGLGKTLEIGMILAELIRRGRGERILVVTPKHIMEQFQQELWSRFAIPLVRLDSYGIQKVRQKLPASRNPFTYFPRVIVSMDTLKSPKYRAQLEKVRWDAVVIDEIHNATNVGTQNNELARTLAPTTEALLLASATPHNGDPESFKEILRLLDPTAVSPAGELDTDATATVRKSPTLWVLSRQNAPSPKSPGGSFCRGKCRCPRARLALDQPAAWRQPGQRPPVSVDAGESLPLLTGCIAGNHRQPPEKPRPGRSWH